MPLIISHGLPKSGSSFLCAIAKGAAAFANGIEQRKLRKVIFSDIPQWRDYIAQPTDEILDLVENRLPDGTYYVLKTHGKMTPRIRERARDGTLKAYTSFRDPRDCVAALLDSGASDRAKGKDRSFAKIEDVKDALRKAKFDWRGAREWADREGVLKIPYYLTAMEGRRAMQLICDHIGLSAAAATVYEQFNRDTIEKLPEFNKGVADRFLDALEPKDIKKLNRQLATQIQEIDELTARWMREHGCQQTYLALHDRREERLKELLGADA